MSEFNKQLYVNSGVKEAFDALTAEDSTARPVKDFFNQRDPNLGVMHEKPEHRVLLMMKARGWSNREIAVASGYSEPWISQLMRQPWAVRTLAEEITNAGRDEIQTLLEGSAADSIRKLIELRDHPDTPATVVRATCENLLDRFLGKPRQQVDVVQKKDTSIETITELDQQIAAAETEINRLQGKF